MRRGSEEHEMDQHVQPRMRVGIIGAGRVGRVLAHASRRGDLDVVAAWSRTDAARHAFAAEFGIPPTQSLDAAVLGCDVAVVAVPDEQLADVLRELAQCVERGSSPLVVLASGSASVAEVGAPVRAAGGRVVRLHPLLGITQASPPDALDGIVAAVSGIDAPDEHAASELARRLGMEPFVLADADAGLWHAAGSIAAGGVTTLLAMAQELAVEVGMAPELALRAMGTLAATAVARAAEETPGAALTGPVVRGDAATVVAHLDALAERRPEFVAPYGALAAATGDLAMRAGRIDADARERLDAVLDGERGAATWA
jgi:predicted short-subunit dehydrogenase-like oxidoreductase (DUF2520 family)